MGCILFHFTRLDYDKEYDVLLPTYTMAGGNWWCCGGTALALLLL